MSNQNLNQFGELGDRLKTIIDDGVNSQDYQKMTKEIKNTVNDAVSGSEYSSRDWKHSH